MLESALKKHFGYDCFREGQRDAVAACMEGKDSVLVMPTGSGKSVCFQLPALLLPGVTLVISPLISLMKDQVDQLNRLGLPATFVNSTLHPRVQEERFRHLIEKRFKLLYLAPERLKDSKFKRALDQMEVSLIAVDEAHCISQWGHDFRPDYLEIGRLTQQLPNSRVMALTATATGKVREDIVNALQLGRPPRNPPSVFVHGFIRNNLHISVTRCPSHEFKFKRIRNIIEGWHTGIIYCATRKQVEKVTSTLRESIPNIVMYHAGFPDKERERVQNQFMLGQADVVVATNAFGMGVDRADVRFVLHWDIPGSMEAYYQEVGRAGRDGAPSWCEMLYNFADVRTQEFFHEGSNPPKEVVLELLELVRSKCMKRPLPFSENTWRHDLSSTRNPMALRTALHLLERAKCLQKEKDPGQLDWLVQATPQINERALAHVLKASAEKAARDRAKLDGIIDYANRNRCRHKQILDYFGDQTPLEGSCERCDVCVRDTAPAPQKTFSEEEWIAVQKILSAAARLNGQFGKNRIAELLKGSKTQALYAANLHHHRCYGLLSSWTLDHIGSAIDALIADGSLEIQGRDYPTLGITPRGKKVVKRLLVPEVKIPILSGPPDPSSDSGQLPDQELLQELKRWRMRTCQRARLKPFHILSNKSLEALAIAKPRSRENLLLIPGIGPAKMDKFGSELLTLISRAT